MAIFILDLISNSKMLQLNLLLACTLQRSWLTVSTGHLVFRGLRRTDQTLGKSAACSVLYPRERERERERARERERERERERARKREIEREQRERERESER